MNEPIEALYFNWLCAKVMHLDNPTPSLTYWKLLRVLYTTEFVWIISGDSNRFDDGLDLRLEFFRSALFQEPDGSLDPMGCSLLELLYGFSRRATFETDIPEDEWFWQFISNLGLSEFNDASNFDIFIIEDCLCRFIWRTYDYNGGGGLFPLSHPKHDQRQIEIWYQFCEYVMEKGLF
jgi:hypothetical protein